MAQLPGLGGWSVGSELQWPASEDPRLQKSLQMRPLHSWTKLLKSAKIKFTSQCDFTNFSSKFQQIYKIFVSCDCICKFKTFQTFGCISMISHFIQLFILFLAGFCNLKLLCAVVPVHVHRWSFISFSRSRTQCRPGSHIRCWRSDRTNRGHRGLFSILNRLFSLNFR